MEKDWSVEQALALSDSSEKAYCDNCQKLVEPDTEDLNAWIKEAFGFEPIHERWASVCPVCGREVELVVDDD